MLSQSTEPEPSAWPRIDLREVHLFTGLTLTALESLAILQDQRPQDINSTNHAGL